MDGWIASWLTELVGRKRKAKAKEGMENSSTTHTLQIEYVLFGREKRV